ncbi:pyrroloquinoline quinone biosynthesis peptide chaperone PqqD [Plasticicumulans sp.]|uniref:pyrroloquinoline quinone biosynthesis peptide chaperone PqqD n=1 Tax=Plasticicumulans sp. TaxID=2307179 RepID=UPI0011D716C4|nr:pyrroloquinoline quinone biosynthesis peptide chaperone PqqD [Plasticicumulans sp.]MBS0600507.1 pyrroloquinoline quinone biosynthesis peptide chaperone PqqD [Pseudomonadota bacterium]TXH41057.1 MAG: pyrroloquinoline quinone biosynthesis peptide chaperone PqqD [Burkholderiaceae bacterium]HMV37848.1 pyrroloquinoline quinone biosynthesis peptide chaperone PqqD [Plasticicumulans sp.]HMW28732.1 pyrroloquinoline quinone biosynthesis peptide chaperone PqqD [Plasticicumulans sp.]HMW41069.1 pyrroloq
MSGARLRIAPGYRLQWEPAQSCHVLLYPEGMVQLNPSAAAVLELCDGSLDADGIVAALEAKYPGADLAADVRQFLEVADERGWLRSA